MVNQPQPLSLYKTLLPHQERLRSTFYSGILLMPLLQFSLQWEQIVDLPAHYLLQYFLMVRLLSSVTPTRRKTLCKIFQLAFKTDIQFTTTKSFSQKFGSLTVTGIHMILFFLSSGAQQIELLRWTEVLDPIRGGTLR